MSKLHPKFAPLGGESNSTSGGPGRTRPKKRPQTPPGTPPPSPPSEKRMKPSSKGRSERSSSSSEEYDEPYDPLYFSRLADIIHAGFKDPDNQEAFVERLRREFSGKEASLAFEKHSSICIQFVIESISEPHMIKRYTQTLRPHKAGLKFLTNQYSSHVFQTIIEAALKVVSIESSPKAKDSRNLKWAVDFICDWANFIIENMAELIEDQNGNYAVMTILEAVGGIRVGRHWCRKTMGFGKSTSINHEMEKDMVVKELPKDLMESLRRLCEALVLNRRERSLKESFINVNSKETAVIEYLLFVTRTRDPDLCESLIKKLVDIVFGDEKNKFSIATNSSSAFLVEAILLAASEHRLKRIWQAHLRGNLDKMWKDNYANFIVQRLIDATQDEKLFGEICDELLPCLRQIFDCNRPGIAVCLAKAAQKFPNRQDAFIEALIRAFFGSSRDHQLLLVPSILLSGEYNRSKDEIWLHGSLILQQVLHFKNTKTIAKSLLSLEQNELIRVTNDKSGSHVIEVFLSSDSVAEKYKNKLIEKYRGAFVSLACDRFGSRIIDYLSIHLDKRAKKIMMEELSAHEDKLTSSRNGFYVAKKMGVHLYKTRPDDWRKENQRKEQRLRHFQEILDSDSDHSGGGGSGGGRYNGTVGNQRRY